MRRPKLRSWWIFFWDPSDVISSGIYKGWFDGWLYVIRIWRFGIDLSDTRLALWLMRDWFND